jgi:hypothetical protein
MYFVAGDAGPYRKRESMKPTKTEIAEARETLRRWVKPDTRVFCILRHVSLSGMSRTIDLFIPEVMPDGEVVMRNIGGIASRALGRSYDTKHDGIKISGCGMDMGFALVDDLAGVLFGSGVRLRHSWL